MTIVWILVFYVSGGPAVIDNIINQTECDRIRMELRWLHRDRAQCIEVRKK